MSEHEWTKHVEDFDDETIEGYRPLCAAAVASLVLGLGSFLVLFHLFFLIVPLIGVVSGFRALRRMAREEPQPAGRWAAVGGIVLAIGFVVASPVQAYTYRHLLHDEALEFATDWFQFVRNGQPQIAFEMTRPPGVRAAMDNTLWSTYLSGRAPLDELKNFLADPPMRALLFLRDKAHVRYYDTDTYRITSSGSFFRQVFAVTYEEDGQKKTFFVRLKLQRHQVASTHQAHWSVEEAHFTAPKTGEEESPLELPDVI